MGELEIKDLKDLFDLEDISQEDFCSMEEGSNLRDYYNYMQVNYIL